jgi:hypothetical protein
VVIENESSRDRTYALGNARCSLALPQMPPQPPSFAAVEDLKRREKKEFEILFIFIYLRTEIWLPKSAILRGKRRRRKN